MSEPPALPYGSWPSPISPEMLTSSAVTLAEPWLVDGIVWWREGRPAERGRGAIVRAVPGGAPVDVTRPDANVRTKVHEYGGGSFLVSGDTVWYSEFDDQRLYRQAGAGAPEAVTPDTGGRHRYADGRVVGPDIVCVRERHEDDGVVNELARLPADGSAAPRTIAGGRDFYACPRPSPDGTRLAWLTWDLPWMPWDGCELWVADLAPDGALANERKVAGAEATESIWQPAWSPGGELHFVSDRTGWWNLYRDDDGEARALCPMEAEFGWPQWVFGRSTYAFLDDARIVCIYNRAGEQHLAVLDPATAELLDLDVPYTAVQSPYLVAEGAQVAFVAGGPATPDELAVIDFSSRAVEVVRRAETVELEEAFVSLPRSIEFPTEGGATAHAIYYPPASGLARGPEGDRPPLIVTSHGGPTSARTATFDLEQQFWTSRGFALVDVNYGGSTGYGRAYRERLNGTWGVTDTLDCINAARYLAGQGMADGDRLLVRGGSAGGYTTLCALTMHDAFAAGVSYFGVSDLEPFALPGGTHKFESRYEHVLIGPYPEAAELYRERSPIHHVDGISVPMLILQGDEDEVVPPEQAEVMVEALRAKGLPYAYLLFAGEQHGFRKAETIVAALDAELSFYAQILGFEPGDAIPRLDIENLP